MSTKSRIVRLEDARRAKTGAAAFCAMSEEVALKAGLSLTQCIITGDPEDDPPTLLFEGNFEDALAELEEEERHGASA